MDDSNELAQQLNILSIEELENKLKTENTVANRNIIRQLIRKKKILSSNLENNNPGFESINDVNILKDMLENTSDFMEQCKIRIRIITLERDKQKQVQNSTSKDESKEWKILMIDEINQNQPDIDSVIIKEHDNVKLIWKLPLKIVRTIQWEWEFNQTILVGKSCKNTLPDFNGTEAVLEIRDILKDNSGIFSITVHSTRLDNTVQQFNINVNDKYSNRLSKRLPIEKPIIEKKELKISKPIESYNTVDTVETKGRNRLFRNRNVIRHNTLSTVSMANTIKELYDNQNIKNQSNQINNTQPVVNKIALKRSYTTARDVILHFCQLNTEDYINYGVKVENLSNSWNDGMAFCALIHNFYPTAFNFSDLDRKNRRYNFETAFNIAEKLADIPQLLDIEDMMAMEKPDWKCVFTYLQNYYKTFRNHPNNKLKVL